MYLKELLSVHQQAFKQKVVEAFAEKHSMTIEQVLKSQGVVIDNYVHSKYQGVERAVSEITEFKRPVILNIRRDPCGEAVCMICERDQPNIEKLQLIYDDRIVFYELYDSTPEAALYHIIHQCEGEKLLPLTAVIHNGAVKKYWSGRPVEVDEYREYLDLLV
ncbi:hypothetical protein C5S53_14825 [Methanophagales archaeon]|nr:hypothetical protein C5S53_14825 [Methanophagales archaeon]